MLTNAAYLKDMVIRATDGDIGTVSPGFIVHDEPFQARRYSFHRCGSSE
jgi:hypothetical protein